MITQEKTERTERERAEPAGGERPPQHNGQTIAGLLKHLRDELIMLFRQEIALARNELTDKMGHATKHLVLVGLGIAVALGGVIVMLIGMAGGAAVALDALGLDPDIAVWLGPILLGAIVFGIGFALLQAGRSRLRHTTLVPEQTVQTLRDDKNWAQQKLHRT